MNSQTGGSQIPAKCFSKRTELYYCQVSLKINQNLIPGDESVYRGAVLTSFINSVKFK